MNIRIPMLVLKVVKVTVNVRDGLGWEATQDLLNVLRSPALDVEVIRLFFKIVSDYKDVCEKEAEPRIGIHGFKGIVLTGLK